MKSKGGKPSFHALYPIGDARDGDTTTPAYENPPQQQTPAQYHATSKPEAHLYEGGWSHARARVDDGTWNPDHTSSGAISLGPSFRHQLHQPTMNQHKSVDSRTMAQLECIPMAYLAPLNSFQNHGYFGDHTSGGNDDTNKNYNTRSHPQNAHDVQALQPCIADHRVLTTSAGFPLHEPWRPNQGREPRWSNGGLLLPVAGELDLLELVAI